MVSNTYHPRRYTINTSTLTTRKTYIFIVGLLVGGFILAVCGSAVVGLMEARTKSNMPYNSVYNKNLTKCQGKKAEYCELLTRKSLYLYCIDTENTCAYKEGKNGCLKKTLNCINNTISVI